MPLGLGRGQNLGFRDFAIFWHRCHWGHPCFTNTYLVDIYLCKGWAEVDMQSKTTRFLNIQAQEPSWISSTCCTTLTNFKGHWSRKASIHSYKLPFYYVTIFLSEPDIYVRGANVIALVSVLACVWTKALTLAITFKPEVVGLSYSYVWYYTMKFIMFWCAHTKLWIID